MSARRLSRIKRRNVRCFVEGPGTAAPAMAAIDFCDDLAEGEHAVIARQIEFLHLAGCGGGAVMRVLEQQSETGAPLAQLAQSIDERRFAPLMHDDETGAVRQGLEIGTIRIVFCWLKRGEGGVE